MTMSRKQRIWVIAGSGAVVLVALCCGGVVVLGLVGKRLAAEAAASASARPSQQGLGAAAPTTTSARPSTPVSSVPVATSQPPKADYAAAAAVLRADNQHYRQQIATGKAAFNTPRFAAWYQATTKDQRYNDDRLKAQGYFTPDTEPASLSTWFADANRLSADINSWAAAALQAEPHPATAHMNDLAARIDAGLTLVDKDAAAVATGR